MRQPVTKSIGGSLNYALLTGKTRPAPAIPADGYAARAQQHRPTDAASLAREAQRLAAQGLTPDDISHVLKIGTVAVHELLQAAQAHGVPL